MIMHKRNVTAIEPMIELPVTASEAIAVGEALKLNAGKSLELWNPSNSFGIIANAPLCKFCFP